MTATPAGYVKSILYEPGTCKTCGNPADDALCVDCLIAQSGDNGAAVTDGFRLEVYTTAQLAALPDPPDSDLLLGPLVIRGGRTIIVGDTGHGKTTFAFQMAAAVLTGDNMLGYDGIGAGPILIVDLEQGRRSIKRTIIESGLETNDQALYITQPDGLSLGDNEGHLAELHRVIDEHRPVVVVLDPFYKAHRGDANEERAIVALMRVLDALRAEFLFALLLPAHPRKEAVTTSGARKLTIHDVAGSAAITRGAEVVLGLERLQQGYARLRPLKDRDGDLPVGDSWSLIFERGVGFRRDPKEEQRAEDLETLILKNTDGWKTVKEWASAIGTHQKKAREILERLRETGAVIYQQGPEGRSAKSKCYMTDLAFKDQCRSVDQSLVENVTDLTVPTSIRDVAQQISRVTEPNDRSVGSVEADDDDFPF